MLSTTTTSTTTSCVRFVLCIGSDTTRQQAARERTALERLRAANHLLERRAAHMRGMIGRVEHALYLLQVERRLDAMRSHTAARVRRMRVDEVARARRLIDERRTYTAEAVRCERQSMLVVRAINDVASASLQREVVESLRDGAAFTRDAVRRLADDIDIDQLIDEMHESREVQESIDEALASFPASLDDDAAVADELERLERDEALNERVGEPSIDAAAAAAFDADARDLARATETTVRARVAAVEEC